MLLALRGGTISGSHKTCSTPLAFNVHLCYRFIPKPPFSTPQAFKGCVQAMFGDNSACETCFLSFVLDVRFSNSALGICFWILLCLILLCNSAFGFCFAILLFNSALQFCFWILLRNSAFQKSAFEFCFSILLLNSAFRFCFATLSTPAGAGDGGRSPPQLGFRI